MTEPQKVYELGVSYKLANCLITRVDIDTEHYYFGQRADGAETQYFLSLTRVLDIGAPFPEGLRNYLRTASFEESMEKLEVTGERGTRLHAVNEALMNKEAIQMDDYKTSYEKDAIVGFIRFMRFLQPTKYQTELIVADPDIRVAGTLDLRCTVEEWKLLVLLNPTYYLEFDADGDYQLKEKYLDLPAKLKKKQRVVIDYKYTGRNAYNHKVQVGAYKRMLNKSRPEGGFVSRAFTYRYSSKHKFGFDFQESKTSYQAFKRIFFTAIDYLGSFPEPPTLKVYPKTVRLFEEIKK